MKPPRLNRQLTLEAPLRVADGSGGWIESWQPLGKVWAQITARSGREISPERVPVSRVNYNILVRAAPHGAPDRPAPEQRFSEGKRHFHIRAVIENDADARYLTCIATEETAV